MTTPKTFVVYHVASTMEKARYKVAHAAHAKVKQLNGLQSVGAYDYTTLEDYMTNVVYMVERVNLMSGQKYMEPSNTPAYCSPACESYWSM